MRNNYRRNWGNEKRWEDLQTNIYWNPLLTKYKWTRTGTRGGFRKGKMSLNIVRLGIQSECRIRFIFPARGFSHIMKYNTTDVILRGQYLLHGSCSGPLSIVHNEFSPAYQSIFHSCFLFCVSALLTDPNKYTSTSTVQNKTVLQQHKRLLTNLDTFKTAYFFCRNQPSVHTKPVNPHIETAYFWSHSPEFFFFNRWVWWIRVDVWNRIFFKVNYVKNSGLVLNENSNWRTTMLCCSDKLRNIG